MSWNYRVVHSTSEDGSEEFFSIHEVYYNKGGGITAMTEDPCHPFGDTLDEFREDLKGMIDALEAPVLEEGKIEFQPKDGNGEDR